MATLRELKGRIGSVASSEKITGAMKMISSAKMHKAELAIKSLLPFRMQIESIIGNLLSADAEFSSPLIESREVNKIGIVVLGSDDGLCGAYNVNIFKSLLTRIAELKSEFGAGLRIEIYPVGAKMAKATAKIAGRDTAVMTDTGVDSKSGADAVRTFVESLREKFLNGELDRIDTVYMSFHSAGRQILRHEQFLPVTPAALEAAGKNGRRTFRSYIFEPDAATIFASVLPLYLLAVMQDVFSENRASEQAARVMAMQSANDNAHKLLEQLRLEYNKLRQQSITTELLDIVGGQIR